MHQDSVNSAVGYEYLCAHLASYGYVAATIDAGFLNGGGMGENAARAILQLEHLRQFWTWATTPGHPLYFRINWWSVMIAGHSRGGEGAALASVINPLKSVDLGSGTMVPLDGTGPKPLGPYNFYIRSVFALAPTDGQFPLPSGPVVVPTNYFLLQGSLDVDLRYFPGYMTFDRTNGPNLAAPAHSASRLQGVDVDPQRMSLLFQR